MRQFIIRSMDIVCQIGVFIVLIYMTVKGASTDGFGGAVVGFLAGLIASVIVFGVVFLLLEIADNTRRTADAVANLYLDKD